MSWVLLCVGGVVVFVCSCDCLIVCFVCLFAWLFVCLLVVAVIVVRFVFVRVVAAQDTLTPIRRLIRT